MKVIMIKKYQKYNIDEVVEVSDGFGTNFLIKNGYALPLNENNRKKLEIKKEQQKKEFEIKKNDALNLKTEIEKLILNFELKVTNDTIHGSISSKKISQALTDKGFKLEKHTIPHVLITSLGITKIKIKLFKDVEAELRVNVKGIYGK